MINLRESFGLGHSVNPELAQSEMDAIRGRVRSINDAVFVIERFQEQTKSDQSRLFPRVPLMDASITDYGKPLLLDDSDNLSYINELDAETKSDRAQGKLDYEEFTDTPVESVAALSFEEAARRRADRHSVSSNRLQLGTDNKPTTVHTVSSPITDTHIQEAA